LLICCALQAFAQVMLLQQETIASLMGMLEEAKAEAAASLAPITRPPSPAKRRALEVEAEAQGRVRQDRCVLYRELKADVRGLAASVGAIAGCCRMQACRSCVAGKGAQLRCGLCKFATGQGMDQLSAS